MSTSPEISKQCLNLRGKAEHISVAQRLQQVLYQVSRSVNQLRSLAGQSAPNKKPYDIRRIDKRHFRNFRTRSYHSIPRGGDPTISKPASIKPGNPKSIDRIVGSSTQHDITRRA
jgi:hypothetical protein